MNSLASIVSVGSWNPAIFTPQWVVDNVFGIPKGESIQINLNEKQMNLTFTWKDISFIVTDSRLEFKTLVPNEDNLILMDALFKHLSEMLSYTPVSALGYNYNLSLTPEEARSIIPWSIESLPTVKDYSPQSIVLANDVANGRLSINVRYEEGLIELACNLQFTEYAQLPQEGTSFDVLKKEIKKIFGYDSK